MVMLQRATREARKAIAKPPKPLAPISSPKLVAGRPEKPPPTRPITCKPRTGRLCRLGRAEMTTPVADGRWAALREALGARSGLGAAMAPTRPPASLLPAQRACQREDPNHGGPIADEGANPYDRLTSNYQPSVASRIDRFPASTRRTHHADAPDAHRSAAQGRHRPQRRRAGRRPRPDGKPRVRLRIRLPDRKLSADIAAKSLQGAVRRSARRAQMMSRSFCKAALSSAT
jgi:hypothetical protein